MTHSRQDVYARNLVSDRGYPLWTPEPNMSLPDVYIREGLKIGDVGVVVPKDGSFDVLFNVCLPPTHSLHQRTGVPNGFTPILLSEGDIARFPEAEGAGCVISSPSVARERNTDASDEDLARRAQPGPLNYEFALSSQEGAVLILPEGAECYYLQNERLFLDEAIKHAVDWYIFAQRRGRIISHDSLYLITGFYKARSWSLAAYQQGTSTGGTSAQFRAVQVGGGNIAANYTWETTPMHWRVGPSEHYYRGIPNQAVFIQGFKIAVREGILGTKWVYVKEDSPSVRLYRPEFSSGPWYSNLWSRVSGSSSGSTANTPGRTGTSLNMDTTENNLLFDESDNVNADITIHRVPQVTKPFHPSDIINQHLLREIPSAIVAVTHDTQWTTLLESGLLDPGELSQEDRLVAGVTSNYSMVLAQEGAVYLQSTAIGGGIENDVITAPIFSESHPELYFTPPDTPTQQLLDDPSGRPYTCAYGSIPFTNSESSHAMYRTAHELQEHVTIAHPDIVGTHMPVFRCGLAGCGQSWKSIGELEHHVESSGAHFQNTNPEGSTGLFVDSSEFLQVLPTIAPARYAGSGTSALEEPREEPMDEDSVGAVGMETSLHRQSSLLTNSQSAIRGQTSRQSRNLIPRIMNNLSTIAKQDDYDEDLEREMRDFNNDDEHNISTLEQASHQQVVEQSSTANLSPLSPHFATSHVPSPPPTSSSIGHHQRLTHGAQKQMPSSGLKFVGTLQQTGFWDAGASTPSSTTLWSSNEWSGERSPSSAVHRSGENLIEIDGRESILSVACSADGEHVVSGGREGQIRRWRVEDGKEVGTPINADEIISNTAVSRDGEWIVSGTESGRVIVWYAESHETVMELKAHSSRVSAVDVSPDGTRIATGSEDRTACVWSLSTGQQLLGPLQHDNEVVAAKFSPDGRRIATATWWHDSLRIYDTENGHLLVDFPVRVNSLVNQSLAWASNSDQLFALSRDGNVNYLDVSTQTTRSRWPIHSSNDPRCIALASHGKFIAASANSSVSFWDTTRLEQIGSVIDHTDTVASMAISSDYDIMTCAGKTITLRRLWDILPSPYFDDTFREREICRIRVEKAHIKETLEFLRAQDEHSNSKIAHLEKTVQQLCNKLADSEHKADGLVEILRVHEQKHQCEALYAKGRIIDAAASLLEIMNTVSEVARANKLIADWLAEFMHRCVTTLERAGDEALSTQKHDEAVAFYSTALSLSPSTPNTVLIKWVRMMLIYGSANEALDAATKLKLPKFDVYRTICNVLEGDGRVTEAVTCFRQMESELAKDISTYDERVQWGFDFRGRCAEKLEKLGDAAMGSQNHDEAIKHYSDALTLDPTNLRDMLFKRGKARTAMGLWEEALIDADKVIELDLSSYKGYERKHAALQGMGRHSEAFEAFKMMLSRIEQSPDPHIRELRHLYVDATPTIRRVITQTIHHMPHVLIDTATGRLYDKTQQAAAFEELPIYHELRSSMITQLDYARIWREVKQFYRYVMFSHTWEYGEPLFQKVEPISIYHLELSSPNIKLQSFCMLIRHLGFQWAWSDTCCIDKRDNVVLQESLVAMFTWYRGSSLTIVYLRGVWSHSRQPGDLRRSIWNTRLWTYPEYVAAETIQFYTEDWKPYLGLDMFNHKMSPAIISEMQQAVGFSTQESVVLRPDLKRVREKLYMASMRQTTLVEDIAYSLLGIFNVAIPVIYGEGNRAVGRLLELILTGSGDVTILAWTGRAGDYNSCLPVDLTVYNKLVPPHIPQPIEMVKMDSMVTALRSSLPDLSLAVMLYDSLNNLPSLSVSSSRLRLPGIVFPITKLVHTSELDSDSNLHVFRATTTTLGDFEIKTTDHLSGTEDFLLIHPWISLLLDQDFSRRAAGLAATTRALRLVTRLRQPFGALLLAPLLRTQYRRVAADSLITVQVREEASLTGLIDGIRTVDIY